MFGRITLFFTIAIMGWFTPQLSSAESHKEEIEMGTNAYRVIRYTRENNAFTCTAMVCDRRDAR